MNNFQHGTLHYCRPSLNFKSVSPTGNCFLRNKSYAQYIFSKTSVTEQIMKYSMGKITSFILFFFLFFFFSFGFQTYVHTYICTVTQIFNVRIAVYGWSRYHRMANIEFIICSSFNWKPWTLWFTKRKDLILFHIQQYYESFMNN